MKTKGKSFLENEGKQFEKATAAWPSKKQVDTRPCCFFVCMRDSQDNGNVTGCRAGSNVEYKHISGHENQNEYIEIEEQQKVLTV